MIDSMRHSEGTGAASNLAARFWRPPIATSDRAGKEACASCNSPPIAPAEPACNRSADRMGMRMGYKNRLGGHTNSYHTYGLAEALEGIAAAGYKYVELTAVRGWTEHV